MNATARRKQSKYRNVHTEYAGMKFSSKAEARYAESLDLAKQVGAIRGWIKQTPFMLGVPENRYVVDFIAWRNDGTSYAIDVKGTRTAKFNRDCKLWERYAPITLHVVTGGKTVEIIVPKCMREE